MSNTSLLFVLRMIAFSGLPISGMFMMAGERSLFSELSVTRQFHFGSLLLPGTSYSAFQHIRTKLVLCPGTAMLPDIQIIRRSGGNDQISLQRQCLQTDQEGASKPPA